MTETLSHFAHDTDNQVQQLEQEREEFLARNEAWSAVVALQSLMATINYDTPRKDAPTEFTD